MKINIGNYGKSLSNWIQNTENLRLVNKRLHDEISRKYLKRFLNIWVLQHMAARMKYFGKKSKNGIATLTAKISPTMRCNLNCKGCFAGNFPKSDDMNIDALDKIILEAHRTGIVSIGIIGGEPLLIPDIFEIFKRHNKIGFYLVTNGLLVDHNVVAKLAELSNVITVFSIEGFEQTNDELRGEDVFNKIMNAMELMKQARLIFGFSTVVHKENMDEVISEDYIDYMVQKGCFFGGFLPYIPVGSTPRYEVVNSKKEVQEYYAKLDALCKQKPLFVMKEGYDDGTFLNKGCVAGHTMHITSRGEAEPCNGIEFSTENIFTSNFRSIFSSPLFSSIRSLLEKYGRECLTINHPEDILKIINDIGAVPTHEMAREHLEEYISIRNRMN